MTRLEEIENELEKLVDEQGMTTILELLSSIAYEKADHLQSNWQDNASAKQWENDAKLLSKLAQKIVA